MEGGGRKERGGRGVLWNGEVNYCKRKDVVDGRIIQPPVHTFVGHQNYQLLIMRIKMNSIPFNSISYIRRKTVMIVRRGSMAK